MPEDFHSRLVAHAKLALDRSARAGSEAAAQQYLVLPFFQLLGYDPLDPDEIIPEAHASFSDKHKNRADYAICRDGKPVIAVECKRVGALNEANRGELKGYFNAVPTVKLGILTDGLVFQFFTDTGLENMMDDEPFAAVDLSEVAQGELPDATLDALLKIRKGTFDPEGVGSDARRKFYLAAYVDALRINSESPDERLVRALMDIANVDGRRTAKLVEEHAPIVADAFRAFFDKMILQRVGFAERGDLVRVDALPPIDPSPASVVSAPADEDAPAAAGKEGGIVTTEAELLVYRYVRERLPFLIDRDDDLFAKLEHLHPVDHKTVFSVYYRQERKGKLFNFWETKANPFNFEFVSEGVTVAGDDLREIDTPLLAAFLRRVGELG